MNKLFVTLLAGIALLANLSANALEYKAVPDWLTLPEGRTQNRRHARGRGGQFQRGSLC